MFKKTLMLFMLLSTFNVYADEQANVTVKLPLGAAFISYVSYASQNVPADYTKTMLVGSSDSQTLKLGDIVLVDTLASLSDHKCDYFQVVNEGNVTVSYTGASFYPVYSFDNASVLNLVHQSGTNFFKSCSRPALLKDSLYAN
ncbi:hypothetical protein [Kistimonas asteriae]|uniref:hypothetical protein n=1 Tax=Kistimonas asteriae TaxID=517724 RepID=UPI001BA50A6E|nr:hypothetical protein [Kistimonas asteriae]